MAPKKVAAPPAIAKKGGAAAPAKKAEFVAKARNLRIGGDIIPKQDLARFTKWPKYVQLQRQKRILLARLKVPPSIAQFQSTLDKSQATQMFRLLDKYAPETKQQKKDRLLKAAETKHADSKKPNVVKFGLSHVTQLVEEKKARMVIIAHDVDPIEMVCWLPALCRKVGVPFCIVKSKSRLGRLVHQKTCSAVALTSVSKEDADSLEKMASSFKTEFNDNVELKRRWGGGKLGVKSQHIQDRKNRAIEIERQKKLGLAL